MMVVYEGNDVRLNSSVFAENKKRRLCFGVCWEIDLL
jgi:hypothetical protein